MLIAALYSTCVAFDLAYETENKIEGIDWYELKNIPIQPPALGQYHFSFDTLWNEKNIWIMDSNQWFFFFNL